MQITIMQIVIMAAVVVASVAWLRICKRAAGQ
jgi:hypothetical protein